MLLLKLKYSAYKMQDNKNQKNAGLELLDYRAKAHAHSTETRN